MAVSLGLLVFMFYAGVEDYIVKYQPRLAAISNAPGVTALVIVPLFYQAAFILLLIMPFLTMRLLSEERRQQTFSLLFSAPLSITDIVLGKFLAMLVFVLIMALLVLLMPLSLLLGGNIDFGVLAAALTGLILIASSFVAIGIYMSALTAQPIVAAISTLGLSLFFWMVDWQGASDDSRPGVLAYLSLVRHYEVLLRGVFDSSDILYYALFIATFVMLAIRRLESERLQY